MRNQMSRVRLEGLSFSSFWTELLIVCGSHHNYPQNQDIREEVGQIIFLLTWHQRADLLNGFISLNDNTRFFHLKFTKHETGQGKKRKLSDTKKIRARFVYWNIITSNGKKNSVSFLDADNWSGRKILCWVKGFLIYKLCISVQRSN